MFKKIEIWIVGIIILFFILLILLVSGVLRDAYLKKNRTPAFLRNNFVTIAEIPKNIYLITNQLINDGLNTVPKLKPTAVPSTSASKAVSTLFVPKI